MDETVRGCFHEATRKRCIHLSPPYEGRRLDHGLVDVAPAPVLTLLKGLYDRVISGVEMFGGMRVLRGIAAPDMPAGQAETQTHPGVACLEAVLTAVCTRSDLSYLIEMCALRCSHSILLLLVVTIQVWFLL